MESISVSLILLLSLLIFRWVRRILTPLWALPLPPGPKGYPVIGNLFNVPARLPWKTFHEWSKIYGDVLYVDVPLQPMIVLDSANAAFELLDKRSDIYSDRPMLVMDELMELDWNLPTTRYSTKWRTRRRLFHQYFNQHEIAKYRPVQLHECRTFLGRLLDSQMDLGENIRLLYSAIILRIAYDMGLDSMDHSYIRLVQDSVIAASITRIPGAFWVEFIPFLRYLPDWIPGTYSKKHAKHGKLLWDRVRDEPFDTVKQNLAHGNNNNSVAAQMIERLQKSSDGTELSPEDESIARDAIGSAYGAAAETTAAAAQSFAIAMSLYPDVQRRAQEELDRVVGPNRLPEFSDYANLIYIQAIILESIRWMPALPLAFPHRATQDGEFRGFLIPKGATIFANVWTMAYNPDDYPEPERFNPDRFLKDDRLNPDVRDPSTLVFGFGRRVCPGRWLSSASLFITIASMLHTMNIHPVPTEDGKPFNPRNVEIEGIVMSSDKVPCTVTPRSETVEKLIRKTVLQQIDFSI